MLICRPGHGAPECRRSGFSILEVVVGMAVMMLGSLSFLSLTVTSSALELENGETALATAAARVVIEELQATSFSEVFATYNADPADDPAGAGTAPGNSFTIESNLHDLNSMITSTTATADPTQTAVVNMTVNVQFPILADGTLSETAPPIFVGMPTDLNADGAASIGDRSADFKVLPCLLVMTWNGSRGPRTLSIPKLLTRKRWQKPATVSALP